MTKAEERRVTELHQSAMDHAHLRDDHARKAAADEREAASLIPDDLGAEVEPMRAVLYRSAVWLSLSANQLRQAKRMAERGLENVIHSDIRAELEEALAEANRRIALQDEEEI